MNLIAAGLHRIVVEVGKLGNLVAVLRILERNLEASGCKDGTF